jgi:hypothetical protein
MKKLFLLATLILIYVVAKSQTTYPVNQYIGAPATLVTAKGGLKADSSLILPVFSDTAKANISTFIKNYAGTLIRVGDNIYVRSNDVSKWLLIGGGGGSGTVTSISQGYGIANTPNPIVATGTVKVDTSVSGLSSKYVRITDTATMLLPYLFGSGTANYVPKFSTTRQLAISQIFDNGTSVGINTATPTATFKLDVNGIGRFVNDLYADEDFIINNYFAINTTATTFPIPNGNLGIWRQKGNGFGTKFLEDEQGAAKDKWAFVKRQGYNLVRDWFQTNSSIVNINYGFGTPNSSNYQGATLLIDPTYNISDPLITNTIVRGIYYNPTLTSLTNTKHIAFESTSGDVVMKGLKKSSSTSDSIAIWINDTLTKAPYPTVAAVSQGYYGAFSDILDQTITSTTTAYPMNFRVTDLSNGVSVVNNNRVLFANAGVYNLQYSAQFTNSSTSTEVGVSVWIRKNGVDVTGSNGYIQLPKKGSGLNGETLPSWNFVLSLAAGDSIVWYWRADNIAASITAFPAGTSPTRPSTASTILTVTQQSGIMAGTGITGLGTSGNPQTGATQTLATGTSGTDFNISSSSNTQTFNLPTASATNRGATSSADWTTMTNQILLTAYQSLGSTQKGITLTVPDNKINIITASLADGSIRLVPVYIPIATTITGIRWYQGNAPTFTADNYNGVGLYTHSAGTLNLVASSTNDAATWTQGAQAWQNKAFSTPYSAAAGTYYIAALYNASAETTAPQIGAGTSLPANGVTPMSFTNGNKLVATLVGATLTTPITMTSTAATNLMYGLLLY